MSMISEQVKELREIAKNWNPNIPINPVSVVLNKAADTIESLSAKLQAANMERSAFFDYEYIYFVKRQGKKNLIVSIMHDRSDNKYHFVNLTSHHICSCAFNTVHEAVSDMKSQKKEGIIEDYYKLVRSADCGGWIPCKNKPQRKRNESSRPVLVRYKDETAQPDVCNYNFLTGKFVFIEKDVTEFVKEWREIPGYEP